MNKSKSFVLDSGYIDGWSWFFVCTILTNGSFHDKGATIHTQYCETELDKERRRQSSLKYWYEHRDEMLIKRNAYYKEHQTHERKRRRKYYKEHREKEIQSTIEWQHKNPEKTKIVRKRHQFKRKRELGYVPLNSPFKNSEGHHLNRDLVIHIPTKLHRSIRHNVFTGKGMKEINALAFQWIATQENFEGLKK